MKKQKIYILSGILIVLLFTVTECMNRIEMERTASGSTQELTQETTMFMEEEASRASSPLSDHTIQVTPAETTDLNSEVTLQSDISDMGEIEKSSMTVQGADTAQPSTAPTPTPTPPTSTQLSIAVTPTPTLAVATSTPAPTTPTPAAATPTPAPTVSIPTEPQPQTADESYTVKLSNGRTTTVTGHYVSTPANEFFNLVNEYRIQNGVPALTWDDSLITDANTRGVEAAYEWGHVVPNGSGNTGPVVYGYLAENLGKGTDSAQVIFDLFTQHDIHKDIMLTDFSVNGSNTTAVSVFCKKITDGYEYYWVQIFD